MRARGSSYYEAGKFGEEGKEKEHEPATQAETRLVGKSFQSNRDSPLFLFTITPKGMPLLDASVPQIVAIEAPD